MKKDRNMASKVAKNRRAYEYYLDNNCDSYDRKIKWLCACGCETKKQHELKHSKPFKDLSNELIPDWIDSTGMHIFMYLLAYIAICLVGFIFLLG